MFEALAYVYRHYNSIHALPEQQRIPRLRFAGFADHDIVHAVNWLELLRQSARELDQHALDGSPCAGSLRVYTPYEAGRMSPDSWLWLQQHGELIPTGIRELALAHLLANTPRKIQLPELKLALQITFWCCAQEPCRLLLAELQAIEPDQIGHPILH